ncbi:MAG: cell division inhibitor, partial [Flavobacteriaceae bacterium]
RENEYFVDEQRFGPYALWHHKHFIRPLDAGIEMEDIVDYKLPLGALGTIAHRFFVKHKIHQIFSYRAERLSEIFGNVGDQNPSINLKSI